MNCKIVIILFNKFSLYNIFIKIPKRSFISALSISMIAPLRKMCISVGRTEPRTKNCK